MTPPLLIKNLKGGRDWIIAVSVCVAEPDEQRWPPWLPCSCTHCLQIMLGGVRGACGRKTEEVWGLSRACLADTYATLRLPSASCSQLHPCLIPILCPTNEDLLIFTPSCAICGKCFELAAICSWNRGCLKTVRDYGEEEARFGGLDIAITVFCQTVTQKKQSTIRA